MSREYLINVEIYVTADDEEDAAEQVWGILESASDAYINEIWPVEDM